MLPMSSMPAAIVAAERGMPSGPILSLMVVICGGGACCTCTACTDLGVDSGAEVMGTEVGG
jgi:hypothetical protein